MGGSFAKKAGMESVGEVSVCWRQLSETGACRLWSAEQSAAARTGPYTAVSNTVGSF